MRAPARIAAASLALAGGLVLAGAAAAQADEDDWSISRYDVTAAVEPDGDAVVVVDFDFDFGNEPGHGPYLTIVELQEIEGDPDHYRRFEVSDVTAGSSTGAPADLLVEREDGAVLVRVGDEDVEVGGVQSYTVTYHLDSLATPGGDVDSVVWNAVGLGWEVPISNVSVTVSAPAPADVVACVAGGVASTTACDGGASMDADGLVTVAQSHLYPGQGLTLRAAYPAGTFPDAEVVLAHRATFANSFLRDPAGVWGAGALALAGAGGVLLMRRRRDRPVASTPERLDGVPGYESFLAGVEVPPLPEGMRTEPPQDAPPGEFGTLVDARAQTRDVVAVLLDLAVRGALHIEVIPGDPDDFELIRPEAPVDLGDYERKLLDEIFRTKSTVRLSKKGSRVATAVAAAKTALDAAVVSNGWYVASPRAARMQRVVVGIVLILASMALTVALALTVGWGLLGVALGLVGILVIALSGGNERLTPHGVQVRAEALAFERYLRDVTAAQPTWDAQRATLVPSVFERYLPYAVALGLERQWTDAFSQALSNGSVPEPVWYGYGGPGNPGFVALVASGTFSQSIAGLGTSVATSAISGGSAGGGGGSISVGGGASGGGGGGW